MSDGSDVRQTAERGNEGIEGGDNGGILLSCIITIEEVDCANPVVKKCIIRHNFSIHEKKH